MFPTANPRVMRPALFGIERQRIICSASKEGFRGGDRFSRHWRDLRRLDQAGIANAAITDQALAFAVARHNKAVFFAEKDSTGAAIDYAAAVSGAFIW